MTPKRLKALKEKGKHLSVILLRPVTDASPFTAIVGSSSNAVFNHIVTVKFAPDGKIVARCSCRWAEHGGIACSHVMATLSRLAESRHRVLSFWPTHEDAARQKRTVFHLVSNLSNEKIWITSRPATAHAAN